MHMMDKLGEPEQRAEQKSRACENRILWTTEYVYNSEYSTIIIVSTVEHSSSTGYDYSNSSIVVL